MLLMGMGGANLLNKAGHEVLGRKQQEGIAPTVSPAASRIQYRQYPDEPLNPRISNPMLQGRCLVANIDHVPCTIQLPDSVIGAHQSGALPLNTLLTPYLPRTTRCDRWQQCSTKSRHGRAWCDRGEYSEARQQNCRERWLGKPIIECD